VLSIATATPGVHTGQELSFREIGKTETQGNTNDPVWTKQFVVDYEFNQEQIVLVRVLDSDTVTNNDALGEITFKLASVIAAPGQTQRFNLARSGGRGRAQGSLTGKAMPCKHCPLLKQFVWRLLLHDCTFC
jgi:Ca2+-dependent lipid-binding protein